MKRLTIAAAAILMSAPFASAGTIKITNTFGTGPGTAGTLDVAEIASTTNPGSFFYDVQNKTGGALLGFGVSNNTASSIPVLFATKDGSADPNRFCTVGVSANDTGVCYDSRIVTEAIWETSTAFDGPQGSFSFESAFGAFDTVSGGDSHFHWYTAQDGALLSDDAISSYFGFMDGKPASSIIGISAGGIGSVQAFTAGQATTINVPAVPLPASSLLLLAGLGSLAAMRKRAAA